MKQCFVLIWTSLFLIVTVHADDLDHVSDVELSEEIERRKNDIERTVERIEDLTERETSSNRELSAARGDLLAIERSAAARAALAYRLSRQGGSLSYLLGSSSAVDFLKRLGKLRYLLVKGLEARREVGLRVARAEKQRASILAEKRTAAEMLEMLSQTLAELEAERVRRHGGQRIGMVLTTNR